MDTVRNMFENINTTVFRDESLASHTSFKIGGPADYFCRPETPAILGDLLRAADEFRLPVTIIGGGTNLLVADAGVRGLVIETGGLNGIEIHGDILRAASGTEANTVAETAAEHGLGGLDFCYALPGSIGGAVYMNARCYGAEISDVLEWAAYIDDSGITRRLEAGDGGFGYKHTPFNTGKLGRAVITAAGFRLRREDSESINRRMNKYRTDREAKGHFRAPCAGSVFKNDREIGSPTGRIIDELGLKGTRSGGAQIAPYHGNIIINTGTATARDVLTLIELMEKAMSNALGWVPEREIRLIGEWA
jgi:UDP-N-acetylmuramate dehydrogenase